MRVIYYIWDFCYLCYSCDMRNQSPSVLCVSSIRLRCGEIKEISVCERSAHSTEQLKVVNPTGMDCQETDFVCRVFGCAADNCYTGIPVALVRSLAGWLALSLSWAMCVCARVWVSVWCLHCACRTEWCNGTADGGEWENRREANTRSVRKSGTEMRALASRYWRHDMFGWRARARFDLMRAEDWFVWECWRDERWYNRSVCIVDICREQVALEERDRHWIII